MASADVSMLGPLFNGGADAAKAAYVLAASDTIAQEGRDDVLMRLGNVLQNPTGFYESQIQTERRRDSTLVTDGKVVYGNWLEGTSSMNARTRFKGYRTFRQITDALDVKSGDIATRELAQYIRRMG